MIHHVHGPSVLLVITDQQRANATGYEQSFIHTPNLNALARSGIVCKSAYVQSPQCQPSRASIFTGRYPTAHRVWWNGIQMPRNELTLGNYLSGAGYRTGYFGKMHFDGVGGHTEIARHFGFQHSFLYEDWANSFIGAFKTSKSRIESEFYGPMSRPNWTGRLSNRDGHHEEIVTDRAVSFIEGSERPFFCVVSYHGPHPPYAAPDEFSALYDPKEMTAPTSKTERNLSRQDWQAIKTQYYGSVSWIDDCFGRLLKVIDDNTIVVYTSDHGDILGDHGLFSKGLYAYDGNTRVPLVFKFPAMRSSVYPHLVQSIDILPTILKACDVAIPVGVQGVNLFDHFEYMKQANEFVLSMVGHKSRLRMVRNNSYKYWTVGDEEVLFDLRVDPSESKNIANSDGVSKMRLLLIKALVQAEDPLPQPV
jgi:arylsulfatase